MLKNIRDKLDGRGTYFAMAVIGILLILWLPFELIPIELIDNALEFLKKFSNIKEPNWRYAKWDLASIIWSLIYIPIFFYGDLAKALSEQVEKNKMTIEELVKITMRFTGGAFMIFIISIIWWILARKLNGLPALCVIPGGIIATFLLYIDIYIKNDDNIPFDKRMVFKNSVSLDISVCIGFIFIFIFCLIIGGDSGVEAFQAGASAITLTISSTIFTYNGLFPVTLDPPKVSLPTEASGGLLK